jgi:hypothetical protein
MRVSSCDEVSHSKDQDFELRWRAVAEELAIIRTRLLRSGGKVQTAEIWEGLKHCRDRVGCFEPAQFGPCEVYVADIGGVTGSDSGEEYLLQRLKRQFKFVMSVQELRRLSIEELADA